MKFIKKHKKGLIILAVVIAVIVGIYFWLLSIGKKTLETLTQMNQETAVAEQRELVSVVAATGKITSVQSKDITSATAGAKVTEVCVEVGDEVKEGDILILLDSSDIERDLANAEDTLSITKQSNSLSINSAQRRYNETVTSTGVAAQNIVDQIADAETKVRDAGDLKKWAEREYDNAVANRDEQERLLEAAERAQSPGMSVTDNNPSPTTQIRKAYELYSAAAEKWLAQYQAYDSQLEAAEKSLESLRKSQADTQRQSESSIAASKDSITSAKLQSANSTSTLEKQISTYQDMIADCTVVAPFDGIVTAINVEKGDKFAGVGAIASVEDISAFEITTEIDEYDIGKIKKGQKVVFKTNGTGDEELIGTVKSVAPRATLGPSVTYKVVISVESKNDLLRLDMTAKLSIVLESSENALTVPYDAVCTDDDGNKFVKVVDGKDANGFLQTHDVYVETGIESDYYIEIVGGDLKPGDEVKVEREASDVFNFELYIEQNGMGGM